ncbi:MAG: putative ABC transport system permease protein [Polaribacter sp.]|jgi:putative ABC transport system permease protein
MAWRDSRRNRGRLLLFISSIILGIAALVAINSFSENLVKDINTEAKTLLGADLMLETTQAKSDTLMELLDSIGGERTEIVGFASMAYFPKGGNTRLSYIKAQGGPFPFYGKMSTVPSDAWLNFREGKSALVDKSLMIQFDLATGDTVKIGETSFLISGQLNAAPGSSGFTSAIAPLIIIPKKYLEETGLLQTGSRVEYQHYIKLANNTDQQTEELREAIRPKLRTLSIRSTTVESRKENIGEAFKNLSNFLNLIGFIALLLGCIGVASSVHIYIKDKLGTVAILRTLGTSGRQAFWIYLIQIGIMGLIGAILGATLGSILQLVIPAVLKDFLPLQNISSSISPTAVAQGIITGLGIALLFALLPLLAIRRTSPLRTLRAGFDDPEQERDLLKWLVYLLIFLFMAGFSWSQTGGGMEAVLFPLAIFIAFALLAAVAKFVMWAVKRFFPKGWSFTMRQGISSLFRPNNQTLTLIVSIGLGTALISTLFFVQDMLLKQVQLSGSGNMPNIILFDIQSSQKEGVNALTIEHGLPLLQEVPVVNMRVAGVDTLTKDAYLRDTTSEISGWVFRREFRSTYRDTLIESETIIDGEWHGEKSEDGTIYVSIAENVADATKAYIGMPMTFNVQGAMIKTKVGSIREINWDRMQTNFFVVFPKGVLEKAPQFHVILTRAEETEKSARFQQALIQAFPNVSAIDLSTILKSVDDILTKVSFVIQFMALFSILTGLMVLISSVVLSKYQRIKESVLLRTLGASGKQIIRINAMEYFVLGSLATLTGILLSFLGSWLIAKFMFEIPFTPALLPPFLVFLGITILTVLIGVTNSRGILNTPPLEILRREV